MIRKTRTLILTVLIVSSFSTAPFQAVGKDMANKTPSVPDATAQAMVLRLQEIKELDMSTLDKTEKKELRSEVREINKELKKNGGGIYLSVGALLVVIVLLILLL
ncbi:MAG TPA: hypothetical protein VK957_19085 [Lunatimonas sp.]|nr:hypothetical protein [Lunatimonas sp.]